ncbi:MAG TPA: hypothetical protein VLM75_01250 [Spirochaetota bacterium]|nr:hypothetical protein [Spirochaetota bacterium]
MPEDKKVQHEIIALKVKINLPRQSSSGLLVVYVDAARINYLGSFSIIAVGQDLEREKLARPHGELVKAIMQGISRLELNVDLHGKLKTNIDGVITPEMIRAVVGNIQAQDIGTAENYVKKAIEKALSLDKTETQLDFEPVNYGQYAELMVEDEVEKMTFAQKIKLVMPYVNHRNDIAESVVKGAINDIALIKFAFERGERLFGLGLIIYSMVGKTVNSVFIAAGSKSSFKDGDVQAPISDFFDGLESLMDAGDFDDAAAMKIESALRRMNTAPLAEAASKSDRVVLGRAITALLSVGIGEGVAAEADSILMNSLRMEVLLKPGTRARRRESQEQSVPEKEAAPGGIRMLNVDLILSPTKGRNISSLRPGDHVQVMLDSTSPVAYKILKQLNLITGDKVKPVGATVYSIKYHPKEGYKVFVQIAKGILGRADEEQDIRIKTGDPVVEETMRQASNSMMIGIIAGVVVLLVVLLLFLLL